MINSLFPDPYDIFLIVTDTAVFTALDLKPTSKSSTSEKYTYIDSRYTMYDLVKITSRKNSGNMITFYFRIPEYKEYNKALEGDFLAKVDQKPSQDYIFAHKRKFYVEI